VVVFYCRRDSIDFIFTLILDGFDKVILGIKCWAFDDMQQLPVIRNYKKLKQINRVHIWPASNATGTGSNALIKGRAWSHDHALIDAAIAHSAAVLYDCASKSSRDQLPIWGSRKPAEKKKRKEKERRADWRG
jgi:hypothetical protein